MLKFNYAFIKAERVGSKQLVRFAAKLPWVCNAKIRTTLKAINEEYHDHEISRSTFKGGSEKLKSWGSLLSMKQKEKWLSI